MMYNVSYGRDGSKKGPMQFLAIYNIPLKLGVYHRTFVASICTEYIVYHSLAEYNINENLNHCHMHLHCSADEKIRN